MRWVGVWLAVLGMGGLVLAGCQPEPQPRARGPLSGRAITFSASLAEEERRAVQELLEGFGGETGATVSFVSVTAADLPERLKVDVAAGRPTIDLFAQDNLSLRVLVDEGLVEDLSDVALPDGVVPAMVPARFDGRQYFLPFRPNVRVAYVNRARLAAAGLTPPATVEELRRVGAALRAAAGGTGKITLPLAQGAPAAVTVTEWIVGFGGDPLVLNDAGSVRAFEALQALWREGLLARESLLAKYDSQVDYLQGETAWLAQNWPFTSGVLAEQGLLGRFQVYAGWQGPARPAHVVGGDVLGVPRGVIGPRREAALALARFLMGRDAQQRLVERNAWPSIRGDTYERVSEAQRETFAAIREALAGGYYRPNVGYWADVSEAMNEGVRRIVTQGEAAPHVLDALHAGIEAAARRRGAPYPPRRGIR